MYLLYGLLAVIIGVLAFTSSMRVVEMSQEYTDFPETGTITFTAEQDMEAPLYVYYEIDGIYQNHRDYVKSVNAEQLLGKDVDEKDLQFTCDPAHKNGEKLIYPCGLVANSQFNDTFSGYHCPSGATVQPTLAPTPAPTPALSPTTTTSPTTSPATIAPSMAQSCSLLTGDDWHSSGIAWSTDSERYKDRGLKADETRMGYFGYNLTSIVDQDFIVWMRPGTGTTIRKLYRVVKNRGLKAGESLTIEITNIYKVGKFKGKKHIVVSTMSWNGGYNHFLGVAGLALGFLFILLSIILWCYSRMLDRQMGDLSYFKRLRTPENKNVPVKMDHKRASNSYSVRDVRMQATNL